ISQGDLVKLFKVGDAQKDLFNVVEAPGLKVLILPNQKKDIVFESTRLSVNDKSGVEIKDSTIIEDFEKAFNISAIDKSKVVAYGFNYDFLAELYSGNPNDFIGEKISKLKDIVVKNVGINVSFEKDGLTHTLILTPSANPKIFLVHFNSHFNSSNVPNNEELKKQILQRFEEFKNMLGNL
ncbi:MAG: hypothetical protein ACRDE5_05165, partial [Ginsengibacter sp.]